MAHHYSRAINLPFSAEDMFAVAADVKAYPRFLPWVQDMKVSDFPSETSDGPGVECFIAEANIGYKAVRERFVTRVRADRPKQRIQVQLVSGPFKSLGADWRFIPLAAGPRATGSRVEFSIEYRFRNPVLQALLAAAFEPIVTRIMDAFVAEAHRRYGKDGAAAKSLPGSAPAGA